MDTDVRRERLASLAKWGLGLIGAVIISPFIFLAVKGILGLALALFIGGLIVNTAPAAGLWLANWRLRMLVAAVEANPIETMQNLFTEKTAELLDADTHIADFETEIRNFDDQIETFSAQYPAESDTYETLSGKMHDALKDMKSEQSTARRELKNFDQQITKAKAIYKMSLAAQRVTQLSRSAEAQVFAKIKEQVAFDSVRTQLNKTFSSLNLALERRADARVPIEAVHEPKRIA